MSSIIRLQNLYQLINAAEKGDLEQVKTLIAGGADVNCVDGNMRTPLHKAALKGQTPVIGYLLEKGALVDPFDEDGYTPFALASSLLYTDVMELLYQFGCNINIERTSKKGCTPLYEAAGKRNAKCVRFLLEREALFEQTDERGMTPMHVAALSCSFEVIKLLLDVGAAVDPVDACGRTPLSWAAQKKLTDSSKYLIERGADMLLKDSKGKSPMDYATESEFDELCSYMNTALQKLSPVKRAVSLKSFKTMYGSKSLKHIDSSHIPQSSLLSPRTVHENAEETEESDEEDLVMTESILSSREEHENKISCFFGATSLPKIASADENAAPLSSLKPQSPEPCKTKSSVMRKLFGLNTSSVNIVANAVNLACPKADSSIKAAISAESDPNSNQIYYSYQALTKHKPIDGIDLSCKESYLSDEDFLLVFHMRRMDFLALPKWKRDAKKKDVRLF